jgi:tetratricopeptide (TPR) repeat protein/transcriptional regulator with XRE-family HTH domain
MASNNVKFKGKKLRDARRKKGLSQGKLGFEIGASQAEISHYELEKRGCYVGRAKQIVEWLDAEFEDLVQPIAGLVGSKATEDVQDQKSETYPAYLPAPPLPSEPFFGRDREIADLKRLLGIPPYEERSVSSPLFIAIYGCPGVGKTAIAMELSTDPDIRAVFKDGVIPIPIGQNRDVVPLLTGLGKRLAMEDLPTDISIEEAAGHLNAWSENRRILLILDDVWDADHVVPFLRALGKGCALVFTTRLRKVIESLDNPPVACYPLGGLRSKDSLELFNKLAPGMIDPPDRVRELIYAIGHLPLSIRVTARLLNKARKRGLDVSKKMDALMEDMKFLRERAPANLHDEHAGKTPSVESLVSKSMELLEGQTQELYPFLGVFAPEPATFDLAALMAIWQVENPQPMIEELIDMGLLTPCGDGRYFQHALLAMHAKSLLKDAADSVPGPHDARFRHACFFHNILGILRSFSKEGEEEAKEAEDRFFLEWAQIRHAQKFYEMYARKSEEFMLGWRDFFCVSIGFFEKRFDHDIDWLKSVTETAKELGASDIEGRCLYKLGKIFLRKRNYEQALSYYREQVVCSRSCGDRWHECDALGQIGYTYICMGKLDWAACCCQKAIKLARKIQNKRLEVQALCYLAHASLTQHSYRNAIAYYEQILELKNVTVEDFERKLFHSVGGAWDLDGEDTARLNLCIALRGAGRHMEAMHYHKAVIQAENGFRSPSIFGRKPKKIYIHLLNLGKTYEAMNELSEALEYYRQAEEVVTNYRLESSEGSARWHLSLVYSKMGEMDAARCHAVVANDRFEGIDDSLAEESRKKLGEWEVEVRYDENYRKNVYRIGSSGAYALGMWKTSWEWEDRFAS